MTDSTKILSLKLVIDDSQGVKLEKVFENQEQAAKRSEETTKRTIVTEQTLLELQERRTDVANKAAINIAAAQQKLREKYEAANQTLQEQGRGWGIVVGNIERATEKTQRYIQEQKKIVEDLDRQLRLHREIGAAQERAPAPQQTADYRGYVRNASGTVGDARNREVQERIALVEQMAAREQQIIAEREAAVNRVTSVAGHSRATRTREETNERVLAYSRMFDQIASGEARLTSRRTGQVVSPADQTTIENNTAALRENRRAGDDSVRTHRNIVLWIGEVIGIYRIYNAIINTTLNAIRAIPKIGIELESTRASLTATAGSAGAMVGIMEGLDKEAQRTGIAVTALRESFRGFQASTSLAGESIDATWRMFTNLNTVITGLHLPADKANGIFLAMAQIFNKTKVQSEELVKQLGNLLPGAFASFAAANRDLFPSTEKLIADMKKGVVFAHDTVEKFTAYLAQRFAPAFALASQGLNANIGRMQTSFTHLGEAIYNVSSGPLLAFTKALTSIADYITKSITETTALSQVFEHFSKVALASTAAYILEISGALTGLTTATTIATAAMVRFEAAMAFLSKPAVLIGAVVALGLELGKLGAKAEDLQTRIGDALDTAKKAFKEAADAGKLAPIELKVAQDPAVKNLVGLMQELQGEMTKVDNKLKGIGFTSTDNIARLKQEQQQNIVLFHKLDSLLFDTKKNLTMKLKLEGGDFVKDLSDIREKVRLLFLTAIGDTKGAATLQFDISNREMKAALEKQIATAKELLPEWQATLARFAITPKLTPEDVITKTELEGKIQSLKDNQKALEEYSIAQQKAGEIQATGKFTEQIGKSVIRSITVEAENSIEALKSEQEVIDNKYENHQLSINQALKERLRIVREIGEVERKAIDAKIVALQGKQELRSETSETKVVDTKFIAAVEKYSRVIEEASKRQGVDPTLIKAMIQAESGGRTNAVSAEGATGIAQFMEATAKRYGVNDRNDPVQSIEGMTKYVRDLLVKFEGFPNQIALAVAGYNAGENRASLQKGQIPNIPETQNYVKTVLGNYGKSSKVAGAEIVDNAAIEEQLALRQKSLIVQQRIEKQTEAAAAAERKSVNAMIDGIEVQYLKLNGFTEQAAVQEVNNKYLETEAILLAENNEIALDMVDALKKQEIGAAKVEEINRRIGTTSADAQDRYNTAINKTNALVSAGIISQLDAAFRLTAANEDNIHSLERQLELEKEKAAALTNDTQQARDDQALKVRQLTHELENLKLTANEVATFFNTQFGEAFDNAFGSFLSGTQSAKQAFRSFAQSVVDDIGKIIAREIRLKAIQGIVSLIGSLAGTAGAAASSTAGLVGGINLNNNSISLANIGKAAGFADGGVASGISSRSGTVLSSPTYFPKAKIIPFASGGVLAGEAGSEAVLPLKRNSRGKLGVSLEGANGGKNIIIQNLSVSVVEKEGTTSEEQAKLIATMIRTQLKTVIGQETTAALRSGGQLNPTPIATAF